MKQSDFMQRSNQPNISRRNFIRTSIGFSLALVSTSALSISDISTKQILEEKLTSILNKRSSIAIGQAILETPRHGLQITNLMPSVLNDLKLSTTSLAFITQKELSLRLDQQTSNDFDTGRTINVSGWVMGYTEAKLCMLSAHRNALI